MKKKIYSIVSNIALMIFCLAFFNQISAQEKIFETANWTAAELNADQNARYQKMLALGIENQIQFIDIGNLAERQEAGKIKVEIPDQECGEVIYRALSVDYFSEADYTWYGELEPIDSCSCQSGFMLLMSKDNERFGSLKLEEDFYSIEDLSGLKNVLIKADGEEIQTCGVTAETIFENSEADEQESGTLRSSNNCNVRVLVLFTPAANSFLPNIQNVAQNSIALTNQAFANSGISPHWLYLELAGVEEVNIDETGRTAIDVLSEVRTIGEAQGLRNTFNADIVILLADHSIANFGDNAGLAFSSNNGNPTSPSSAYAVVRTFAITNGLVFSHEIGHLFGTTHEPCDADGAGANCINNISNSYWHAHSFNWGECLEHRAQTIGFSRISPDAILRFSNPNTYFQGKKTGAYNERDNARVLRDNGCTVAGNVDNNIQNLTVNISASAEHCPCHVVQLYPNASGGGAGAYQYEWQISIDGINWSPVQSTSATFSASIPCGFWEQSYFVRVRVEAADGQVTFDTYYVYPDHSLNCTRNSSEQETGQSGDNSEIKLSVYPNPTNDNTTVEYELAEQAEVSLSVVNQMGQEILKLVDNEIQERGEYRSKLDIKKLSPGIYFLQLQLKDVVISRKFVALK